MKSTWHSVYRHSTLVRTKSKSDLLIGEKYIIVADSNDQSQCVLTPFFMAIR